MEWLYIALGFVLHEGIHLFLAIGGFALVKKIIKSKKCCNHSCNTEDKEN